MKSMINIKSSGEVIAEELRVYHAGFDDCEKGYGFGPLIRDHYLIHFVVRGKGIFQNNRVKREIGPYEAFLITPNMTTYYEADSSDPWSYYWIGFHGREAGDMMKNLGLSSSNPVITFNQEIATKLNDLVKRENRTYIEYLKLRGELCIILAELATMNSVDVHKKDLKESYIDGVKDFIEMNYSRQITVDDMANHVGINRSYLSRLFKSYEGCAPKEYLLEYRLFKAKYLLEQNNSVAVVARSVGYTDPYTFSKAFTRRVGISPKQYTIKYRENL